MLFTEFLKLKKPEQSDFYNVDDFNENMDKIETVIKSHTEDKNNPHEVGKEDVGLSNVENLAINDQMPTYSSAGARENIRSGEKLSTAFGKIQKWMSDLKTVAFTGSYNDLSNKPVSLPANGGNADTVDGKHYQEILDSYCSAQFTVEDPNTTAFPEHAICYHENCPYLGYWWIDTVYYAAKHTDTIREQIARHYYQDRIYRRYYNPQHTGTQNGWSPWHKVINSIDVINNLGITASGYVLDARQGKILNDKMNTLFTGATAAYSIYYPKKDYIMNGIGSNSNQKFGFLNLYNSYNDNSELYTVTKTDATSAECTGTSSTNPTNYVTVKTAGLYQIEVRLVDVNKVGLRARIMIGNSEVCAFGIVYGALTGSGNLIQYIPAGSRVYVVIEFNGETGDVKLNMAADGAKGVASGLFIKKIL